MKEQHLFRIAGFRIAISFESTEKNSVQLLPSYSAFTDNADDGGEFMFTLHVDDNLHASRERELIRKFDTGNGDTLVYLLPDGGYQYIIRNIHGHDCCLLKTSKDFSRCECALNGTTAMRAFGLNDAIMLIFAFRGSFYDTLLIHASCVRHGGLSYPFIAKSGTGKSTHSSLWLKHIPDTDLINDDNPIVRVIEGRVYLFGSPWSGKTPCYRNVKTRLGAITKIERAPANRIERLRAVQAFATLLPSCSSMKWDSTIYNNICDTITKVISSVPVYTMHCLPDEDAAHVCHDAITAGGNGEEA